MNQNFQHFASPLSSPAMGTSYDPPEALVGRQFTLGTFPASIIGYDRRTGVFIVKFEGCDLMEIDSTTIYSCLYNTKVKPFSPQMQNISVQSSQQHTAAFAYSGGVSLANQLLNINGMDRINGYLNNTLNNIQRLNMQTSAIQQLNQHPLNLALPAQYKKSERLRFQKSKNIKRRTTLDEKQTLQTSLSNLNIHQNVSPPRQNVGHTLHTPIHRSPRSNSPMSVGPGNVEKDIKTQIMSVFHTLYMDKTPSINEIEHALVSADESCQKNKAPEESEFVQVTRIAVGKLRRVAAQLGLEENIINAYITICPICSAEIRLTKLSSFTTLIKHLQSHAEAKELIKALEEADLNRDVQFKLDKSIHKKPENRRRDWQQNINDESFLEAQVVCWLLEHKVLAPESILVQEIWLNCCLSLERDIDSVDFQALKEFQIAFKELSPEAFDFYISEGHPNAIALSQVSHRKSESEQKDLDEDSYAEKTKKIVESISECISKNCLKPTDILSQEILRTPKKFRSFEKLLSFFRGLYGLSSKAYEWYVGEGVTGGEFTRGKPVGSRLVVSQGKYRHYGLSRKSLQRLLEGGSGRRGSIKRKGSRTSYSGRRRKSSLIISSEGKGVSLVKSAIESSYIMFKLRV
eukprot:snap_masked-scaffold_21-processed-gene-1.27-mRNA-1 protein AED:1.00 eAED:1.00 QI:0/0/0/0/1/1/3/0/631